MTEARLGTRTPTPILPGGMTLRLLPPPWKRAATPPRSATHVSSARVFQAGPEEAQFGLLCLGPGLVGVRGRSGAMRSLALLSAIPAHPRRDGRPRSSAARRPLVLVSRSLLSLGSAYGLEGALHELAADSGFAEVLVSQASCGHGHALCRRSCRRHCSQQQEAEPCRAPSPISSFDDSSPCC